MVQVKAQATLQSSANLILRLLWRVQTSEDKQKFTIIGKRLDSLAQLANENLVILRLEQRLKEESLPVIPLIQNLAKHQKLRIRETVELIEKLTTILEKTGIKFFFTKSFQHYPDMGHDIDLFVSETSSQVDQLLKQSFRTKPDCTSLLNHISNKTGLWIDDYQSPVEIHHGLMGHLGEYRNYPKQVMARSIIIKPEGINVRVPAVEDQLIIQVIQRVYGHRCFRLSDLIIGTKLLGTLELDWPYIQFTIKKMGIYAGFSFYANYMAHIYQQATDLTLDFHTNVPKTEITLFFSGSGYKIKEFPNAFLLFLRKWLYDLIHFRWESFGRLSLLPIPFFVALVRRISNKLFIKRTHS